MSNYTPDLSGMDWNYYSTTYQRTIFRAIQKLKFDVPVFQNERFEIGVLGNGTLILEPNVDWVVQADDIDYDAMSVCKSINSNFTGILLKSITIIRPYSSEYKVQVKFNQLFADYINYARINKDQTIEVTPTLVGNMLEQLTYLQQMVLNPSGLYSPQSSLVKILDENPAGDSVDHLIVDEKHDIDTINGIKYIRPIYGAFFYDSVVVRNGLSNEIFVIDVDYVVLEVDLVKTRATSNPSGVYRTIHILKPYVGEIKVAYRAYGGIADVASVRQLHDRVWAMEEYLSRSSHVTPATLPADPTIIAMRNKLQEIEGQMRLLLQNGLPTYGDVSGGSAVLKKVTAVDQLPHWWSIATLYRVDGSSDNILADVFKFRIKTLLTGLMFECSVAVNVNGANHSRIKVTCNNSNIPTDTLERYIPRLRLLEVTAGGVYSGVVLQLGMKLPNILQETFVIEDMSGREGCWKLVPFDALSTPPEDTGVLMPNGVMAWAEGDIPSVDDIATIPFSEGLNLLLTGTNVAIPAGVTTSINDMVAQEVDELDMSVVKTFQLKVVLNIASSPVTYQINVPLASWDVAGKKYGSYAAGIQIGNVVYDFVCTLQYESATQYTFSVSPTKYGISADTLNLTGVKLLF